MKSLQLCVILCLTMLLCSCTKKSDDGTDTPNNEDKSANLLAAGDSANDLLSNENFTKLKIEIAYVTGFKPSQEALDEFVNYVKTYTFKEDIELVYLELPSPDEENLTTQEIADLEIENRTVYNNGDTLGIYIYFADAPSEDDNEDEDLVTLGAVYRNTTMVIHEGTIINLARRNSSISEADIEIATINHEFGHLFGLVDLGTDMVNNHQDTNAINHCNQEGCLMRGELQFGGSSGKTSNLAYKNELHSSCALSGKSVLKILQNKTSKSFQNAVPLGAECILDLQANGGR